MWSISDLNITSPLVIGPMAGITNGAFREVCYGFGAGLTYTEMTSDKAIYYGNKKTLDMLEIDDRFHPVALQLFGTDVESMVYAAKVMDHDTNCDIIDINMGCPVNKVIKTGAGSAMMKEEDRSVETIRKIVENVKKPVTVKMRLGFDKSHMNYLSLSKKLEEAGVSAIALHARTRSQMYEGHSDWSHIAILKKEMKIPVIGNGDVKSVEDFIQMKEETNCDAVMISRGVVGNPFLIKEINNYLSGKEDYRVSIEERFEGCLDHARKLIDLKGEKTGMREMRGLSPHYLSGLYMSSTYKNKMISMETYEDLRNILEEYHQILIQHERDS
ncbi:MAG: tRNA dihydrouridine synthase DusB [Erysipelotrichaceae bacterium]|nr:tRNA dihydrouridine synthase DusB [Erysipelotrichaceae bacterium]